MSGWPGAAEPGGTVPDRSRRLGQNVTIGSLNASGGSKLAIRAGIVLVVAALAAEVAGFVYRQTELHRGGASTVVQSAPPGSTATPTVVSTIPATTVAPTTTTTVAVPSPVKSSGLVTYTLPAGTVVTVTAAHGPCWVEASPSQNATALYQGTLAAGATQRYTSPVFLRFGSTENLIVTARGLSLELPGAPGDLAVQ